jgi:methyl-accepting chemotaxis protein
MRRGAATTARALEEQATAGGQVSQESERLARVISGVSRAMGEQATAATQITTAAQDMRQQSEQVAKAMNEQSRAARDMTGATESISKEIGLITRSNRQHLASSEHVMGVLTDIRQITERNAQGVKATLVSTAGLIERAEQLVESAGGANPDQTAENGAHSPTPRPGANGKPRRVKRTKSPGEVPATVATDEPDGSRQ